MVRVPVLSEQMAVAFPIVSQASRWRTRLLSFIIFWKQKSENLRGLYGTEEINPSREISISYHPKSPGGGFKEYCCCHEDTFFVTCKLQPKNAASLFLKLLEGRFSQITNQWNTEIQRRPKRALTIVMWMVNEINWLLPMSFMPL